MNDARGDADRFIRTETDGPVGTVILSRPDVMNAWHGAMRREVVAALREFNANSTVRAVIMTGAGSRAFCAGQDLNETATFDAERGAAWIDEWRVLYDSVREMDKPVIAALNGVAAGSGFQMALLADVRVAHPGVRMGQPEIDSGIPTVTGLWIIREHLGLSRTTELIATGRLMTADECHAIGLVHHLVPEDQVLPTARTIAGRLAAKPPVAMRLNRRRIREATQAGFADAMAAAVRIHREAYASGEPQEMMARFLRDRANRTRS